jgi:hypothetical protein
MKLWRHLSTNQNLFTPGKPREWMSSFGWWMEEDANPLYLQSFQGVVLDLSCEPLDKVMEFFRLFKQKVKK